LSIRAALCHELQDRKEVFGNLNITLVTGMMERDQGLVG
jgi:hypothetical protein